MKALQFVIASIASLFTPCPCISETCVASFYGRESGRYTANRERFNPMSYTAASLTYNFGTMLLVSFHHNFVVVRVNDRGPAPKTKRCIDLSQGAAKKIKLPGNGTVHIKRLG